MNRQLISRAAVEAERQAERRARYRTPTTDDHATWTRADLAAIPIVEALTPAELDEALKKAARRDG